MDGNGGQYHLYLRMDDGEDILLATAKGSPFWTEIYRLAVETYGSIDVYYLFS